MPEREGPARHHRPRLSSREALLFEAGVKLGGVFHQYLGIPVTAATARGLARTIESAVKLQPYVAKVRVKIEPNRGGPAGRGRLAYRYLTAEMLRVDVELRDRSTRVAASLAFRPDLRYPLMRVEAAGVAGPTKPRRRSAARKSRRSDPVR